MVAGSNPAVPTKKPKKIKYLDDIGKWQKGQFVQNVQKSTKFLDELLSDIDGLGSDAVNLFRYLWARMP